MPDRGDNPTARRAYAYVRRACQARQVHVPKCGVVTTRHKKALYQQSAWFLSQRYAVTAIFSARK